MTTYEYQTIEWGPGSSWNGLSGKGGLDALLADKGSKGQRLAHALSSTTHDVTLVFEMSHQDG